jgi:hypothetical protein
VLIAFRLERNEAVIGRRGKPSLILVHYQIAGAEQRLAVFVGLAAVVLVFAIVTGTGNSCYREYQPWRGAILARGQARCAVTSTVAGRLFLKRKFLYYANNEVNQKRSTQKARPSSDGTSPRHCDPSVE